MAHMVSQPLATAYIYACQGRRALHSSMAARSALSGDDDSPYYLQNNKSSHVSLELQSGSLTLRLARRAARLRFGLVLTNIT
eukprot:6174447-Pleurochrysis_carterae.AAC.3